MTGGYKLPGGHLHGFVLVTVLDQLALVEIPELLGIRNGRILRDQIVESFDLCGRPGH